MARRGLLGSAVPGGLSAARINERGGWWQQVGLRRNARNVVAEGRPE